MQQLPRPEARIANLEKQSLTLGARLEELSEDTVKGLENLRSHVDLGFSQAHSYIVEHVEKRIIVVEERLSGVEERMTGVEERLSGVEERMTGVEERLSGVEERMTGVEERLSGVEERMTGVEERLSGVEERMTGVEERLSGVEERLVSVETNMATKEDLNALETRLITTLKQLLRSEN